LISEKFSGLSRNAKRIFSRQNDKEKNGQKLKDFENGVSNKNFNRDL